MENKICMPRKRVRVSGSILYHLLGDRLTESLTHLNYYTWFTFSINWLTHFSILLHLMLLVAFLRGGRGDVPTHTKLQYEFLENM